MIKKSFLFLCSLLFLNCSENSKTLKYDETKIAILNVTKHDLLQKYDSSELKNEDISEIEKLIKKSVENYNSEQIKLIPQYQKKYPEMNVTAQDLTINLDKYKRQYIPYSNNNERIVWVYCTIDKRVHAKWKSEILFAAGGGENYFQLTINLSNKTYSKLLINGPA